MKEFEKIINDAWDNREKINSKSDKSIINAIRDTVKLVDQGKIRVAEKKGNEWITNQWIKKSILLSFKVNEMQTTTGPYSVWMDKVKGKTQGWSHADHLEAGFRFVPNGVVRFGSYIAKGVVLMPTFVNIGAYIDEGTMMDTFSRAGSCCQIGKNCHISAGSGVGGVLEPLQANPTIIEDNVFLGAMSEIVEGVIVGQSTKIVNRQTGEISYGRVPPYSVVVPGTLPDKKNPSAPSLNCAVIIKQVDEKTRSKTSINDLLRD
jgi:2,3,4,5-tetrahydropyridine-2-carboxylate N-succinyltransferase